MSDPRPRSSEPHENPGEPTSPRVHSTGRGGVGNIQPGAPKDTDTIDSREDAELYGPFHKDGM